MDEPGMGWWVIEGVALLAALRRAHEGDSPDIVFAELWANTSSEYVEPDDNYEVHDRFEEE